MIVRRRDPRVYRHLDARFHLRMHRAAITHRERPAHTVVIARTALVVLGAAEVRRTSSNPQPGKPTPPPIAVPWPGKYFCPAVREVAEDWPDEHGEIVRATPYSLRRGMISLRMRAGEDPQAVAKQCGRSVEMLELLGRDRGSRGRGSQAPAEERIRARQLALAGTRRQL